MLLVLAACLLDCSVFYAQSRGMTAMTDNLKIVRPQDPTKINIHEAHEVRYWTNKWNITAEQLRAAHAAVGPGTAAIAKRLGKQP
jgi:hypothetical protein